jgi:hypothetical protein
MVSKILQNLTIKLAKLVEFTLEKHFFPNNFVRKWQNSAQKK